jgi:uncharacterized delta-60 repeat protein
MKLLTSRPTKLIVFLLCASAAAGGRGLVTNLLGADSAVAVTSAATELRAESMINDIAVQPDGKLVAVGTTADCPGAVCFYYVALARYNRDGSLDETFGGGDGIVTTDLESGDNHSIANAVTIQPDGRIVVAGVAIVPFGGSNEALFRYNADGSLDQSFGGGDGIVLANFGEPAYYPHAVAISGDGRIVTFDNRQVTRYDPDGSIDQSFGGGDGFVRPPFFPTTDGVVLPGGKILVAGAESDSLELAHYDADGSLDQSFGGGDGVATAVTEGAQSFTAKLAVQADAKILLSGEWAFGIGHGCFGFTTLDRLNSDGSPDPSFSGAEGNGVLGSRDAPSCFHPVGVATQGDGRIILTGGAFAAARFLADGSIDRSFGGGDGVVATNPAAAGFVTASVLRASGKIIVAGQAVSSRTSTHPRTALAVVGYRPNGTRDPSFGGSGVVLTPPLARCLGQTVTISATAEKDRVIGSPQRDVIAATDGDDIVLGRGGNDLICAGPGDDRVRAGDGADHVLGGDGNDVLRGGRGRDHLTGGAGKDSVRP